jgi:hypothetical protein
MYLEELTKRLQIAKVKLNMLSGDEDTQVTDPAGRENALYLSDQLRSRPSRTFGVLVSGPNKVENGALALSDQILSDEIQSRAS